jgi:hypothetical protein
MNKTEEKRILFNIRAWTLFFMIALIVSGVTAFPLETEMKVFCSLWGIDLTVPAEVYSGLKGWIATVAEGIIQTNAHYPFMAYGTDWLAFAHIIIAVAFIGLYREPVRNKWIIHFGMIACGGIIPLALICGIVRHIPFYWTLIDCSFGIFGFIPLLILHHHVKKLDILHSSSKY